MSQLASATPRRSARVASTARSVAASRAESIARSVAGSTVTPSRAGGKRKGPLPKIKTTQSHAYGSTGNVNPADDLEVPESGFGQAFIGQRGDAVYRDVISEGRRTQERSVGSHFAIEEDVGYVPHDRIPIKDLPSVISDHTSVLDISKSFGNVHEAGMEGANGNAKAIHPEVPRADVRLRAAKQPSQLDIAWRIVRHNWVICLSLVVMFLILASSYIGGAKVDHDSPSLFSKTINIGLGEALRHRASYVWSSIKENIMPHNTGATPGVSKDITGRISQLETASNSHDQSIKRIEKLLPYQLAVPINRQTGKPEIPDDFWRALLSKIKNEGLTDLLTTKDAEWIAFLEKNEVKLQATVDKHLESGIMKDYAKRFDKEFNLAIRNSQVLTRDEFLKLMREDFLTYVNQIDAKVDRALKDVKESAKKAGAEIVKDQIRLESLAYANLIANSELAIKKVNFFSTGIGARVDPLLTSPTQTKPMTLKSRLYTSLFFLPARHPPITALERWEEASDCWCSAPNRDQGKAQLAVNMAQTIFPTQVTIEHIPKEGTLDPLSAPKWMELWVEIVDRERRGAVLKSWNEINSEECSHPGVGKNFACIGRFRYDIHASNHIQTFDLELDLAAHNVQVSKAVIRVVENWGRDWTCIYRIRMHGDIAEPTYE